MQKLRFVRSEKNPTSKTGNLPIDKDGFVSLPPLEKGVFVKAEPKFQPLQTQAKTKKELAAMRREKSKRDKKFLGGKLTTNYRGRIIEN